ncbi:hypothetical protein TNIN_88031 [Trichonephila inaurata madagascariensis]|uniref:Uncharacterized protein n=1 Tax=Trichonephila inaurata madagascariensis TaxID=2747483 RepID=A0A8X6YKE6_9ARAC|nr:hypothetical protein TNIN_88031 [Trichonephila inaurata madagascariensis]
MRIYHPRDRGEGDVETGRSSNAGSRRAQGAQKEKTHERTNWKERAIPSSLRNTVKPKESSGTGKYKKREAPHSLQSNPNIKRRPGVGRSREGMTSKEDSKQKQEHQWIIRKEVPIPLGTEWDTGEGEETADTIREIRARPYNVCSRAGS